MLAYWEGFFKAQVPVPAGNVFLSPKPFITDYQMVLAILKLEFMLYIYIYIGNFVHIDDLHFGPFPLRTTKKGISSNSPKKGQLFSLHQAAGYVTIKKAAFQPTSVCRKNGSEQKILLLMPGQFTGLSGEMKSSVLSYYGATLHTRTPREGPRALLPFFGKGDFALCGGRPGGSAPGPRDFLKKIE